jgi:hypothetical protein
MAGCCTNICIFNMWKERPTQQIGALLTDVRIEQDLRMLLIGIGRRLCSCRYEAQSRLETVAATTISPRIDERQCGS